MENTIKKNEHEMLQQIVSTYKMDRPNIKQYICYRSLTKLEEEIFQLEENFNLYGENKGRRGISMCEFRSSKCKEFGERKLQRNHNNKRKKTCEDCKR